MSELEHRLERQRVLPVLRTGDPETACRQVDLLADVGLDVIELTATIPDWPGLIDWTRASHPHLLVGAGTVTSGSAAQVALDHGVDFLVSPWPSPVVAEVAGDTPFIEGGFTPGEVAGAAADGLAKLFPAHVGGPAYLRSLLAVLPGASIVPTGGIALADVGDWLAAGAHTVGVGSDLAAMLSDDRRRAADLLAALNGRSGS